MNYHIGTRSVGKKRQGGYREPFLDYFGDVRGTSSLIKFGMERFEPENETLRRNTCEAGHVYSVTEPACPVCRVAKADAAVQATIAGMVEKLMHRRPGECRYCGDPLPVKSKGSGRQSTLYCDLACSRGYWNQQR